MKLLRIIIVGFDVTNKFADQIFAFFRYRRNKWEYNERVHQLFVDFKKAYDSVRREILYNFLIEFGVPMELIRRLKCV
jgi:hypothetical protein